MKHSFDLGAFLKQLAKIGHCFAYACTQGKGYQMLLPPIIIGNSEYASHYIGGIGEDYHPKNMYVPLDMRIFRSYSGSHYLVVRIQLLNIGSLPPYLAVAGYIPDLDNFHVANKGLFNSVNNKRMS